MDNPEYSANNDDLPHTKWVMYYYRKQKNNHQNKLWEVLHEI